MKELDDTGASNVRAFGRGASATSKLETVDEGGTPETGLQVEGTRDGIQGGNTGDQGENEDAKSKVTESGSESGASKSGKGPAALRPLTTSKPTQSSASAAKKPPYSPLIVGKGKNTNEGSTRNLIVETETVSSVSQPGVGLGLGERSNGPRSEVGGSLRLKPSSETIRPKKERKKVVRKSASVSGTASSKADIFEAKVASAVDEANSSDSDETYVYESNPAESTLRAGRHHSRTPSATSTQSTADYRGAIRPLNNLLNGHRGVGGKRSMKFCNNPYTSNGVESQMAYRYDETLRGSSRGSVSSAYHQHIGRFGRIGSPHEPLFDTFSPGSKLRSSTEPNSPRQSNRPRSPMLAARNNLKLAGMGLKKSKEGMPYDFDAEGADDERTPLVGTVQRTPRVRGVRRPVSGQARDYSYYQQRRRGSLARCGGCIVFGLIMLLVVLCAVGFLFATTKPLYGVQIQQIQNVLASEQEIMLDLLVSATNPNVVAITVSEMDVNIFAKSKYVGTDRSWRDHGHARRSAPTRQNDWGPPWWPHHGEDEGTNPMPDPEKDSQTMLLGRVFALDSALIFDGSPLKRHQHSSTGELRLGKPGNQTEAGGTQRWERVIQHPFELIVRGVLKYELPLNGRLMTAPIGASVVVQPETEDGVDEAGGMSSDETIPLL